MRLIAPTIAAALAASCGTPTAQKTQLNSDVAASVPVYRAGDDAPAGTELGTISGLSCKQLAWHPKPTRRVAMDDMKIKALSMGADAIVNVREDKRGVGLVNNCWSSIELVGTAIRTD